MSNTTKRLYKNTADKMSTWFVIFFVLVALTIGLVVGIVASNNEPTLFIPVFFGVSVPLVIGAIILGVYVTSSKVKAKRGQKKLDLVIAEFTKKYRIVKDIKITDNRKIDYILLTPFKLYSITVKNYVGNITGMESDDTWRESLAFKKKKVALPNPIKENISYIETLNKHIKIDLEPVVVLISGNRGYIYSEHLYSPNQLEELLRYESKEVYSDFQLEKYCNILSK